MSSRMKDSGVEWLGRIPSHWDVVPPKALFTESKQRARDDDQLLSATQKYGVIPLADFERLEQRQVTKANANLEMRKHVEVGDFVISMRSMDGGLERSRAVGSVRSSYTVLKPGPRVDGRFFGLLLKSDLYIQALRLTSNFIRDGQDLSFNHVRQVKLPLPRLEEQAAIAGYIGCATDRIDTLIAKKTRFIELLREKRQALITHAVTKGLDPKVPMKDSGVKWIGMVPSHWSIGAARRFSSFSPSRREIGLRRDHAEVSFLPMEAIGESGGLDLTRTRRVREVEVGYSYFADGDIVIAKITPCFENGKGAPVAGLVGGAGFGTTELIVLRPGKSIDQRFAWWLFSCGGFRKYAEGHMEGSAGQKRVPDDWFKAQKIAVPPRKEQLEIVAFLDRVSGRIDSLIEKTEQSIGLLREHRTALITAAVTGKLDIAEPA